ncbi:MAG: peroxidase [Sandaracinus sp.]|nr:peroxidase [Sandaracinus sp.]MCB9615360.1 peroxidase [Sandaracinus sp.]
MGRWVWGLSLVCALVATFESSADAQYCSPSGAVCDVGRVCEPVSSTLGVCCADDPQTGMPPVCIGPDGPAPATVLASDLLGLLSTAQDPALVADLFTGPWTNWYYDGRERGLAKLALMRGILERYNLTDMYVGAGVPTVTDPARPSVTCEVGPYAARTLDGTCNHPSNPLMGAQGTRFGRNVPLAGAFPNEEALLTPNPRVVSRALLRRPGLFGSDFKPVPFLNNIAGAWTQFQIHDWFDHGRPPRHGETIEVPLDRWDPLRRRGMRSLSVPRTRPDPTRVAGRDDALPPTYTNEVTHWWDGSQIYGSDEETAHRLREHVGGRMRMGRDGLLPVGERGYADTGMRENFWVGLEMLHTLFVQEHNSIADMLAATYPAWDDERLFQTARMINAALIAKIHTLEWTPAILPSSSLNTAMNTNWYGLNHFTCPQLPAVPGLYPNPVVYGVVGNPGALNLYDAAFAMTEEFVSVYRMHPLLPEYFVVRDADRRGRFRDVIPTDRSREAGGHAALRRHGMTDMLYSFGISHPGALVLDNYPAFLQDVEIPGRGVLDMGTIDILRDRERGVPRYNDARQMLFLPRVPDFETLTAGDHRLARRLEAVYGDIDQVDLLVGTLAEGQRPSCYGFGETLFQVFTLMATRRLQADRYYTELYNADTYSAEGLAWVENNSMKSVLLRHYPELAHTGLADVANAFYPWE